MDNEDFGEFMPLEKTQKGLAKANEEKWKAVQKALDLTEQAGNFLGGVLGPAKEALGGLLGDQFQYWRAMNINRLAQKFQKVREERGIVEDSIKHLPFSAAYRSLDAVSLEDDESVQDMWAELLGSATDPNRDVKVKKVYIELLKSMSSVEVALLNLFRECEERGTFRSQEDLKLFNEDMNKLADKTWRTFLVQDQDTAIQNLVRLRCVSFRPSPPYLNNLFGTFDARDLYSSGISWPGNLALVNPKEFETLIKYMEEVVMIASGVKDYRATKELPVQGWGMMGWSQRVKVPEMNYILTPLAKDLLKACKE